MKLAQKSRTGGLGQVRLWAPFQAPRSVPSRVGLGSRPKVRSEWTASGIPTVGVPMVTSNPGTVTSGHKLPAAGPERGPRLSRSDPRSEALQPSDLALQSRIGLLGDHYGTEGQRFESSRARCEPAGNGGFRVDCGVPRKVPNFASGGALGSVEASGSSSIRAGSPVDSGVPNQPGRRALRRGASAASARPVRRTRRSRRP